MNFKCREETQSVVKWLIAAAVRRRDGRKLVSGLEGQNGFGAVRAVVAQRTGC